MKTMTAILVTYGLLYNWYAVNDSRHLAPEGWHLPSDEEWKELEMYLGMSQSEADADYWRGADEGSKLKSNNDWYSDGNGTNSSGFNALPGGHRGDGVGNFYEVGVSSVFWTSTEYTVDHGTYAWMRALGWSSYDVFRLHAAKEVGFSVRCLKD